LSGAGEVRRAARRARAATVVGTAGVVVVLDQVSKAFAVARLASHPVELAGPLRLELAYNRGMAFSLLSGFTVPIVIVVVVLLLLLGQFARRVPSYPAALAVGMMIGGALGNLADRVFRPHGEVVDFLYTGVWPTFNLADASIVCGGALLAVSLWRSAKPKLAGAPR
jgi:signal peptidase II